MPSPNTEINDNIRRGKSSDLTTESFSSVSADKSGHPVLSITNLIKLSLFLSNRLKSSLLKSMMYSRLTVYTSDVYAG